MSIRDRPQKRPSRSPGGVLIVPASDCSGDLEIGVNVGVGVPVKVGAPVGLGASIIVEGVLDGENVMDGDRVLVTSTLMELGIADTLAIGSKVDVLNDIGVLVTEAGTVDGGGKAGVLVI